MAGGKVRPQTPALPAGTTRAPARTRREFLATAAGVAGGVSLAGLAGCFPDVGGSWAVVTDACRDEPDVTPVPGASRVAEVYREDSVIMEPAMQVQPAAVRPMLDEALAILTDGAATPWSVLLPDATPESRIGLKVNCLNRYLATSVPMVQALIASLTEELGLAPSQIVVWDRRLDELTHAGFTPEALGTQVLGTVNSTTDPSGPGYSQAICGVVEGKPPLLSRILTELTDLTINCPVLKTHNVSGVTGALKNIYGVINNPGDYHQNLVTALPALYRLPPIRRHFRLTIIDALIAVTIGGTSDPPDTQPRRILASADPVALDSYALALVNELRAAREPALPPVDPGATAWLPNARDLGLGTLDYELVARPE